MYKTQRSCSSSSVGSLCRSALRLSLYARERGILVIVGFFPKIHNPSVLQLVKRYSYSMQARGDLDVSKINYIHVHV